MVGKSVKVHVLPGQSSGFLGADTCLEAQRDVGAEAVFGQITCHLEELSGLGHGHRSRRAAALTARRVDQGPKRSDGPGREPRRAGWRASGHCERSPRWQLTAASLRR
jgi:hypothetical protein